MDRILKWFKSENPQKGEADSSSFISINFAGNPIDMIK